MKIFIVFGTRPEAIKLAPLIYRLRGTFSVTTVSSGQHSELLQQVIDFFKIQPHYSFGCMVHKPGLEHLYECIHRGMRKAIDREEPDLIIVQGDTFSSYAAGFVGFMFKKPVFHVEAGLRTFQKYSPFPEEMLRVLISRITDFHFAPTLRSKENLIAEGIPDDKIMITGNTIVDALRLADRIMDEKAVMRELRVQNGRFVNLIGRRKLILVTSHRRENIGTPLRNICSAVKRLAKNHADACFIWPLHKNPEVIETVNSEMAERPGNIFLTETLSYQTLIYLMKRSHLVMTDSGGIQEEVPAFSKPVLILRETTERPEVIDAGFGFLVGTDEHKIIDVFSRLYNDRKIQKKISKIPNPFGDGEASDRIYRFLTSDNMRFYIRNFHSSPRAVKKSFVRI